MASDTRSSETVFHEELIRFLTFFNVLRNSVWVLEESVTWL